MTEPIATGQSMNPAHDPVLQGAAIFLGQVLGITDSPDYLAADLSPIKRDANASIFTIQLDSSVGPAAFLVYAYDLHQRGGDGRTGKELFDAGLTTLQQAAQRAAPGPRAVAHAETDILGFILATTPGTYRALTGDPEVNDTIEATAADLAAIEDAARYRSEVAQDLLESLRNANQQATDWLAAIQVASQGDVDGDEAIDDLLAFTEAETELALYLLDDDSIGNLLRALNLLVASAQQQAAQGLERD
ncbi:MAG: hypothetical protein M3457_14660 [Chloroflexota bacterium]|nr:hypothetical protein [Chloroflexota bacterium]